MDPARKLATNPRKVLPSWPAHKGRRTSKGFLIFGEGEMPGEEQQAQLDGPRFGIPFPKSAAVKLLPGHCCWVQMFLVGTCLGYRLPLGSKMFRLQPVFTGTDQFLPKIPGPGHAASLESEKCVFMYCM